MRELKVLPIERLGEGFIEPPYLPEGKDEYYLRDEQAARPVDGHRPLRADEIETLVKNGNRADDWNHLLVTDEFTPEQIVNCQFHGLVRIGRLEEQCLEHHDMRVPVGLTNSRILACDLGDDVAVHNVRYLAHYIIGDNCIVMNLDEMHCTNHAKFGNGIVKEGEGEEVRIELDLVNEAGGRSVLPFDGMTTGDAWLWAMHPGRPALAERLREITQRTFDPRRGFYGTIGDRCVIKNCRIIKDVKIGDAAYIKGANKLKNLTIASSEEQPSQIGEGVELVNGIIGYGCHVFYGCKAVRFVMGENSNLKYGARLIHSVLGDNSTVSCCELLNNLIFPAHEQHHNNSFLIASLVMGQSNLAAAATIGSNHNSRAPDGELHARRGFWPGLCVSLKHNSRFASFTLLAKGDYPAELDVPLPFALVANDEAGRRLCMVPAYWWRYNMYALARNSWKFGARDKRLHRQQKVEFASLAPDTAEEMIEGRRLLALWTGRAAARDAGDDQADEEADEEALVARGRALLEGPAEDVDALDILAEGVEKSPRPVCVIHAREGYAAYAQMLLYYALGELAAWMETNPKADRAALVDAFGADQRDREWVNCGGQIMRQEDVDQMIADICEGRLDSWDAIHARCDELWEAYPDAKRRHALAVLLELRGETDLTADAWSDALDGALEAQRYVAEATFASRKKDFEDPFRRMCYASDEEMEAVLGSAEANSFVQQVRAETEAFEARVRALRKRG